MDISNWISNPDRTYQDGLVIYHKIKSNQSKDQFFNSVSQPPKGSLHYNLLLHEIKNANRIIVNSKPDPHAAPLPKPTKQITTQPFKESKARYVFNELVDVKTLPEHLQALYFRNQEITRVLSGVHQSLKAATTDADRKQIAEQIRTFNIERIENWQKIDAHKPDAPQKDTHPDVLNYEALIKTLTHEIKHKSLTKNQITYRNRMITSYKRKITELNKTQ